MWNKSIFLTVAALLPLRGTPDKPLAYAQQDPPRAYQEPRSVEAEIGGHNWDPDPPRIIAESSPAPPVVPTEEVERRAIEHAQAMDAAFLAQHAREQRDRETRDAIHRAVCNPGPCASGAY
jgi:hypothetical protein